MKRLIFILTLSFCSLTVFCAGKQNLVRNGTFDSYDQKTGRAAHWAGVRHQQVVEEGLNVTPCMRLCAYYRSSNKFWKSNTSTVIPVIKAGTYRFSFKVRGPASMYYMFLVPGKGSRSSKRFIHSFNKLKMKVLPGDWRQGAFELKIPAEMKNASLILESFFARKGEYEFLDDVSFVKIK